jgi:hypothetical protein
MKNILVLTSFALGLGFSSNSYAVGKLKCENILTPSKYVKLVSWRAKITNGAIVKSDANREGEIKTQVQDLTDSILQSATPAYLITPATGVKLKQLVVGQGYQTRTVDRFQVSGLGKSGTLSLTALLPVSAHTTLADARSWAKSDTYYLYATVGDKNSYYSGKRFFELSDKSKDLVTLQELSIKLPANKLVTLFYYRSGSAGVGGYIEGRAIELIWDGK